MDNETKENSTLKEKVIRLETTNEASVYANDLKSALTSNIEESNSELKKLNMSLLESSKQEREEFTIKLDAKDKKLDEKDSQVFFKIIFSKKKKKKKKIEKMKMKNEIHHSRFENLPFPLKKKRER